MPKPSVPKPSDPPATRHTDLSPRLRAVCDLFQSDVRENAGIHDYDGRPQDLSPEGVKAGLAALGGGRGSRLEDPHDEAHLAAFEDSARVVFDELELHRRSPYLHLENLDLACYEREYAPAAERAAAKRSHLRGWPEAIEGAIRSMDQVPAPVAQALLPAVQGLASGLPVDGAGDREAALAAHGRLVAHLEAVARDGSPDTALGEAALARLMGAGEATEVDLDDLATTAASERDRLRALLDEACGRLEPGAPVPDLVTSLHQDHPDAGGVLSQAREQTQELLAFVRDRQLVPASDGECLVGPAPASRRWAMAMMTWAGPFEEDAPSWYHVTPPEPDWPAERAEQWLQVFSRTTLPVITAHEVAPGHYSHGRALRRVASPVRRALQSTSFAEGWAHYTEELMLEVGFRADDPRFQAGVALEGLTRVTRLACAIGLHTGELTVEAAAERFERDALASPAAALSEARRGTFDPTYGRYTWAKLRILQAREQARARWGEAFSLPRFHAALLDLGSPPLGLIGTALDRG